MKEIVIDNAAAVFPMRDAADKFELQIKTMHEPDATIPIEDYVQEEDIEDMLINATIPVPDPVVTAEVERLTLDVQVGGSSSSADTRPDGVVAVRGRKSAHSEPPRSGETATADRGDPVPGKPVEDLDYSGKQQRPYRGTTRVPGIWTET